MPASPPVANVQALFTSFVSGSRLVDGGDLSQMAAFLFNYNPVTNSGGSASTQVAGTQLNYGINVVAASVINGAYVLPDALPGGKVQVINNGASAVTVYGNPMNFNNAGAGDTIAPASATAQTTATSVGVAQAAARVADYVCFAPGQWKQNLYPTA